MHQQKKTGVVTMLYHGLSLPNLVIIHGLGFTTTTTESFAAKVSGVGLEQLEGHSSAPF
jgi:hypothetical protein